MDNSIKIDEICSLGIPNQISTTSMHLQGLVKFHWHLLKYLLPGNENTDCQMNIRQTDAQADTNMKPLYPTTFVWRGIKIKETNTK